MTPLDRKLSPLIAVSTILVLVLLLYWGKPVLMPLALALLFSFLLNPVVNALHRRGLPRGPAVLLLALFGTPLWFYGVLQPSYKHAADTLYEKLRVNPVTPT